MGQTYLWNNKYKLQNQEQKWHQILQETEVDGVWTSPDATQIQQYTTVFNMIQLLHHQTFLIHLATQCQYLPSKNLQDKTILPCKLVNKRSLGLDCEISAYGIWHLDLYYKSLGCYLRCGYQEMTYLFILSWRLVGACEDPFFHQFHIQGDGRQ